MTKAWGFWRACVLMPALGLLARAFAGEACLGLLAPACAYAWVTKAAILAIVFVRWLAKKKTLELTAADAELAVTKEKSALC